MKLYIKAPQTVTRTYFSRLHDRHLRETIRHSVSLNVEPTLPIGALKTLLKPYRWIPKKKLLLFHSDKPLHDDGASLTECFIKEKDTLLVCNGGSYPVKVCTHHTVTFYIPISSCLETVDDMMDKIHLITGFRPEDQLLYFGNALLDNEKALLVTLGIVPDYINKYIYDVVEVRPKTKPEQRPSTHLPAKFLAHMRDLTCDMGNHMNIFVEQHVPRNRACTSVRVKPTDTIDTLKTKISDNTYAFIDSDSFVDEETLISRHRNMAFVFCQRLLTNGSATLAEYGIKDHDVIQCCDVRCFEIFVSWASPNYEMHAEPPGILLEAPCFDTVGGLKEKIEKKTSIPAKKQNLMRHGISLDNDEWCLLDYGIIRDPITSGLRHYTRSHYRRCNIFNVEHQGRAFSVTFLLTVLFWFFLSSISAVLSENYLIINHA